MAQVLVRLKVKPFNKRSAALARAGGLREAKKRDLVRKKSAFNNKAIRAYLRWVKSTFHRRERRKIRQELASAMPKVNC